MTSGADDLPVAASPALLAELRALLGCRLVFFAGLPATGKSLLTHQLAHLADAAGRRVTLLQWDVARRAFEESEPGRAYPIVDGITDPVVIRATGLWARAAVAAWHDRPTPAGDLMVGELPLIGGRLVELVERGPASDRAEVVLTGPDCRFLLVVPSAEVRRHIEAERRRRFASPLHAKELDDAPSHLLDEMWRELVAAGRQLGVLAEAESAPAYQGELYRRIYAALLRHRPLHVVQLDQVLPTAAMSVYAYGFASAPLLPSEAEVERYLAVAAAELASGGRGDWWQV
jgi:hypothetical protein